MPVEIRNGPTALIPKKTEPNVPTTISSPDAKVTIDLEQIEAFGRLKLTNKQMAAYYNVSVTYIIRLMKRTDARQAYEHGRAETIVAIRQKQMQMALAGDGRMLLHVGEHFGDQDQQGSTEEMDSKANDRSWHSAIMGRAEAIRQQIVDDTTKEAG